MQRTDRMRDVTGDRQKSSSAECPAGVNKLQYCTYLLALILHSDSNTNRKEVIKGVCVRARACSGVHLPLSCILTDWCEWFP